MKKEISKKNKNDLTNELNEKRLALREIRFAGAGSKSKNVKEQKTIKREIARIKTAINLISN